ncbi:GNAT family N-acetyltransferase [Pseudoxanthomonas sacheonensis]|uniref:RimJ/RimL family protein N-acetyltransferase n=1 Tax=Pseudoxanthomonas sacheonensis TaxID=443615 RepID=A0ABU1RM24_9GAMM|nr:GNAT family N-acetyltransferase [Pseudoxanthomonas sacheonensis]MDR6839823.1 RimJ/RimL family protein N-acetyltransferase [Pseudoxanthomonas sacheonensis]
MAERQLQGEGFLLRPWRESDLDALVRHADDEQVSRGVSDRFPFPYTRQDGENFLSGRIIDLSDPVFAIEIEGEACGGIGAHRGKGERAHSAEFGYWLGRAHWGKSTMTRVVSVFTPWAMRELRLYRLYATVLGFNIGSAQVLRRNGFLEEGVQRAAVFKRGVLHDLRLFAKVRRSLDDDR